MRLRGGMLLFLLYFAITNSYSQAPRKILVEEFTGTWCGDCPNGRTATEHLDAKFGNSVICIGLHNSDSLSNTYSEGLIKDCNVTEFPLGFIDRTSFHSSPDGSVFQEVGLDGTDWDEPVKERLKTSSPIGVNISNTYNTDTRQLQITITADFLASVSGNMRFNCILIEDSVPCTNQRNSNNNYSASPWYHQGDPIVPYFQRNVARLNLSANLWGDEKIIPVNVFAGASFKKNYSCTLSDKWNHSHVKIVAFISNWGSTATLDTSNFGVINANIARLNPMLLTGSSEAEKTFFAATPYPNPFSNSISFPVQLGQNSWLSMKVYNVLGLEVADLYNEQLPAGEHVFSWAGTLKNGSPAPNGIYICQIITARGTSSRPVLLNR